MKNTLTALIGAASLSNAAIYTFEYNIEPNPPEDLNWTQFYTDSNPSFAVGQIEDIPRGVRITIEATTSAFENIRSLSLDMNLDNVDLSNGVFIDAFNPFSYDSTAQPFGPNTQWGPRPSDDERTYYYWRPSVELFNDTLSVYFKYYDQHVTDWSQDRNFNRRDVLQVNILIDDPNFNVTSFTSAPLRADGSTSSVAVTNYNNPYTSGQVNGLANYSTVPEPSISLLALAGLLPIIRRKR